MFQRLLPLFLATLFAVSPATAEVEVHVVGVYEGPRSMTGNKVGREVQVLLDRPGAEVILVLSSYRGVDWQVAIADGTAEPTLVLLQMGREDPESTVWLNGVREPNPVRMTLPLTYRPEGKDFRALVALTPDRFGVPRIASFNGSYSAPDDGFAVREVVADNRFDPDYLRPKLANVSLPASLRALLPPVAPTGLPPVALTEQGFVLTGPDGSTKTIPLPPDMPELSWPVAAVRDPARGMLYGVTFGGDGTLYGYDEARQAWRVIRSMEGFDAAGMILDPFGQRLILTVGRFGASGLVVGHDLSGPDTAPLTVIADLADLPGLTDLYDPDNGPAADLVPTGIEGDLLLITSTGSRFTWPRSNLGDAPWRAYLVDLTTGIADFVGYEGGIAGD